MSKKADVLILEIDKVVVPELDAGSAASVASLAAHPGFQYLLAKLRAQRALLKNSLEKTRHKEMRDVEFLQSGANWCNWLQIQLEDAIKITQRPQPRQARSYELEGFEQLASQIDVVGRSSRQTTDEFSAPQGLGQQ